MKTLAATAHNTFDKIWRRNKYKVLFLICCALSLVLALYSHGGRSLVISGLALNLSRGSYAMLEVLNTIFMPLVSFMLCADYFAHELSDGTIKAELLRPVGRGTLYFGKLVGMFIYCAAIMAANLLIGSIVGIFTGSLGSVPIFILAHLMSLLVVCSFLSLSAFVAMAVKHPSLLMFLLIIGYVLAMFVGTAFSQIGAFLFTSYLNWYKMIMGSVIPWRNLFVALGLLLSGTVFLGTLGQAIFDRRDIA